MTPKDLPQLAFVHEWNDGEDMAVVYAASQALARAANSTSDSMLSDVYRRAPEFDVHAPGPVPVSSLLDHGWYSHCANHGCGRRICYDEGEWASPSDEAALAAEGLRRALRERKEAAWLRENPEPARAAEDAPWAARTRARAERDDWAQRHRNEVPPAESPMLDRSALRFDGSLVYCSLRCQQDLHLTIARTDLAHEAAEAKAASRWPGAPSYSAPRWPQMEPRVSFRLPGMSWDAHWDATRDEVTVMPCDLERWKELRDAPGSEKEPT